MQLSFPGRKIWIFVGVQAQALSLSPLWRPCSTVWMWTVMAACRVGMWPSSMIGREPGRKPAKRALAKPTAEDQVARTHR